MILEIAGWLVTGLCIVGVVLNAQKKISGFYVWIVTDIYLVAVNIYYGIYAQAALFGLYGLMCFYGIYVWGKDSKEKPMICKRCDIEMVQGQALQNTLSMGVADFPGNTIESEGQTVSRSGPAVLIKCWKCPECGQSFEYIPCEE